MNDYLQQFKTITDKLASTGSIVSIDELHTCILDGLPLVYRSFASSIRARSKESTLSTEEL